MERSTIQAILEQPNTVENKFESNLEDEFGSFFHGETSSRVLNSLELLEF